jgi:MYXO-CTERM domain-containing protein
MGSDKGRGEIPPAVPARGTAALSLAAEQDRRRLDCDERLEARPQVARSCLRTATASLPRPAARCFEKATVDQFGRDRSNNDLWEGNLAELIIHDRELTVQEHGQVGMYLSDKWGVTWPDTRNLDLVDTLNPTATASSTHSAPYLPACAVAGRYVRSAGMGIMELQIYGSAAPQPVAEPAGLAMLGLSLLGLRRKRK